jgi:flagellar basal-body rod protein FlgC
MDDFVTLDISGAGMKAQRMRMRVIAENLANQQTTGPDGPYQRKDVVLEAVPLGDFSGIFEGAIQQMSTVEGEPAVHTVAMGEIRSDGSEPIRVYDPSHPHADARGYVAYPNISVFREMTDLIEASHSYEANLAAARTSQQMIQSAMDLLK